MQTTDGGYIAGLGEASSNTGYLVKVDANGKQLWSVQIDGWCGPVNSVMQTTDGGYIAGLGEETSNTGYLVKFDANGKQLWSVRIDGWYGPVNSVIQVITPLL